jgi:hypothetical protein
MANRIPLIVCIAIGIGALGYGALQVFAIYQERDEVYFGKLHRAKSEIATMATAAESFRKATGHYPGDLSQLTTDSGEGRGPKTLLATIPVSPWSGPYYYKIEHGANGDNVTVWAVPDQKTQERIGLTVLSNSTDWRTVLSK